ncbi:hypothetical protein OGAPHI_001962 [Ogataea philodendri]|uniref:Uncharacterized protein n=1 Tax=Ogataea philodendri TaxID=1378263 RepID=A0A9P8T6K5_9ASCO|nr:uncharacterized protein OGAPHI_001962 [Ogataea philodendri]KAH3668208.1 hypothetical protein OGAPHI_001962 [Ogataea philodendri]
MSLIQALSLKNPSTPTISQGDFSDIRKQSFLEDDDGEGSTSTTNTDTVSQNVSVQEFFFNNPKRLTSDEIGEIEEAVKNSLAHNSSAPKFIKPKSRISTLKSSVSVSVSEKPVLKAPEVFQSSLKVNRGNISRRRSSSHLHKATETENKKLPLEPQNAFHDDEGKVTPFGGFSKPDYHDLFVKDNVFASAPWRVVDFDKGNGSLRNAVRLARKADPNQSFEWIGILPMPSDVVPEDTRQKIAEELEANYHSSAAYVDDETFDGHYNSFSKQILWPIFHYQIPDNPKNNAFENHSWTHYEKLNQAVANKIVSKYKEGDIVWVNDYHLMLVPKMVREKLPNAKIGFFLHVSFPSSEVFRCLAQRNNILEGLLGADCITFQTKEYVRHFYQTCNRLLLADFDEQGIRYKDRDIGVTHNPIGIDASSLNKRLQSDKCLNWRQLVRERWPNKKLILSRDKIDKIRGIKEKLLAYERFLNDNPDYLDSTILILIYTKGRAEKDDDYENTIFNIVERINSKANNISADQPVILLHQDIEFEQYLALLSEADMFIVSTLREGMNLTSHEFVVAAQETHSPLIMSEFVGSVGVFTNGPLITNPYNIKQVAEKIKYGLEMSPEEKLERWKSMYSIILAHDSQEWTKNCIKDIEHAFISHQNESPSELTVLTPEMFTQRYNDLPSSDSKRLFVINVGNLASKVSIPGSTINPVQHQYIDSTLYNLAHDPQNVVYVLSYLKRSDLLRKHRRITEIGLIAENGGYIKLPNSSDWFTVIDENELSWMPTVIEVMNSFCERLPGSYVEVEECTVRFHTESCADIDKDHRDKLIGELITHVNELYSKDFNLHANLVNGIVIVQEANLVIRALSFIMNQNSFDGHIEKVPSSSLTSPMIQPADISMSSILEEPQFKDNLGFIMAAGGNTPADEEMFNYFNNLDFKVENTLTVRVGQDTSNSKAEQKLKGVNELFKTLSQVSTTSI